MPFISIIIPVYNVCAYLEKCVQSVVNFCENSKYDFEVILVDDGSNDGSSSICDKLSFQDKRISVSHQSNQGVSVARNTGIIKAKGTWIWFVDSDDYIMPVSKNVVVPEDCNFVITGFVWDENGVIKRYGATCEEIPYNLWRCWFCRDIIMMNDLTFTEGRKYAEDQEFILKYMASIRSKFFDSYAIDEPLYYYTIREGSAMTKNGVKAKMIHDIFMVLMSFIWLSIQKCSLFNSWTMHEIKRLLKTLFVTAKR